MWLLLLQFLEEYAKIFKVVFDAVEPFFLALAAGCSLWWWFRRRERVPIPAISIGFSIIPLEDGELLARIETQITNIGKVLLKTGEISVYIQQIDPIPETGWEESDKNEDDEPLDSDWPIMRVWSFDGDGQLFEPGQSGSTPACNMRLSQLPRALLITVAIQNPAGENNYWKVSKLVGKTVEIGQ